LHVAQRFELFLDTYRRPDGTPWTGQKLDEATGGVVPRAYFTNLRKGRIENPGYEKMLAIARAMGFPPVLWFEDASGHVVSVAPAEDQDLTTRVGRLFETMRHPKTGEPCTDAGVARMSEGVLTEDEVEGMRTGNIPDPTVGQAAALAAVFGVPASYLVDRQGAPTLDAETLAALSDETAAVILRESARLREREKLIVLGISREFAGQHDAGGSADPTSTKRRSGKFSRSGRIERRVWPTCRHKDGLANLRLYRMRDSMLRLYWKQHLLGTSQGVGMSIWVVQPTE
jgi:transcriptional regulator with XRE-family HTH domain